MPALWEQYGSPDSGQKADYERDDQAVFPPEGMGSSKKMRSTLKFVFAFSILIAISGWIGRNDTGIALSSHIGGEPSGNSVDHKEMRVKLSNADYNLENAEKSYPFLSLGLLAEPGRETTIHVLLPSGVLHDLNYSTCSHSVGVSFGGGPWDYTPGVVPAKEFNPSGPLNTSSVGNELWTTTTFPSPGVYTLEIACDSLSTTPYVSHHEVSVYYIRRELRKLTVADRQDFLYCFETMMHVGQDIGMERFGRHFKSLDKFELMHLDKGGARRLDHLHDGMGLVTQHIALSSEFEQSMQSIKSHMALPYWDYTIDGEHIRTTSGIDHKGHEESALFLDSELFTVKWFGRTDSESNVVTEGPFAYQEIPRQYKNISVRSPYGYLRAPWNINPNKYVTRYHKLCGEKVDAVETSNTILSWPTCAVHLGVTNSDETWYHWAMDIGYTPHGPVHAWVGGVGGMCDTTWDEMHHKGWINIKQLRLMKFQAFQILKNMWRAEIIETPKYCSPDANVSQCMWICEKDNDGNGVTTLSYVQEYFTDNFEISADNKHFDEIINRVVCETPFWPGDQLEAASPVDISFWPIHPTIDRLLQYKHMVRPFKDNAWPNPSEEDTCVTGGDCKGHNAYDLTFFRTTYYDSSEKTFKSSYITNEEVRSNHYPHSAYAASFIYDDFLWDHCEETGHRFKLVNESDAKSVASALC